MTAAYEPPSWSCLPQHAFSLSVVRDGIEVETIDLSKRAYYVLGRLEPACDIILQHESISRQHAVLQFGEKGELYVTDLASTHGTKLNRTRVEPRRYSAVPIGSMLQFGESTRLYIVQGPPGMAAPEAPESAEHAALRLASEARQARKTAERAANGSRASDGVTWGQREDAVDDDDNDIGTDGIINNSDSSKSAAAAAAGSWVSDLDLTKLSEKEREIADRLAKRSLKLRNVAAEVARISAKAAAAASGNTGRGKRKSAVDDILEEGDDLDGGGRGGLSEGQLAQIAKNEESIVKLTALVEEDEDVLRSRLEARGIPLPASALRHVSGSLTASSQMSVFASREALFLTEEDEVQDAYGGGASMSSSRAAAPKLVLVRGARGTTGGLIAAGAGGIKRPRPSEPPSSQHHVGVATKRYASPSSSSSAATVPDTLASLQSKLDDVRARLGVLREQEVVVDGDRTQLPQPVLVPAAASSADDALDAYMNSTTATLAVDAAVTRRVEIDELVVEASRLEYLVGIATPALPAFGLCVKPSDSSSSCSASAPAFEVPVSSSSSSSSAPASAAVVAVCDTVFLSASTAGPVEAIITAGPVSAAAEAVDNGTNSNSDDQQPVSATSASAPLRSRVQAVAASGGSLAALRQLTMLRPAAGGEAPQLPPTATSAVPPQLRVSRAPAAARGGAFDSEVDADATWVPPVGQSGDGRTSLYDKLGY